MATSFDRLRTSSLSGGGGLLGLGRPLTPEEEEELLRQQMMAANDPLAPLPDEGMTQQAEQPFVLPAEEEVKVPDVPFVVPVEALDTDKPIIPDQPLTEEVVAKAEKKRPLVKPLEDMEPDGMSIESVMQALSEPALVQPNPDQMTAVDSWIERAKQQRIAELQAIAAQPTENREATPNNAVHARLLQEAVNSADMRDATLAEFKELDKRLADEVFPEGEVKPAVSNAEWMNVIRYFKDPDSRGQIVVNPEGKITTEEPSPDAEPTFAESLRKGAAQTVELTERAKQAVAEVIGADKAAAKAGTTAEYYRALQGVLPQGTKLGDIRSVGDTLQWMQQTVGEQGVLMAAPLSGAVVGRIIGGSTGAALGAFGPSWALGVGEVQAGNKAINPEQKAGLATLAGGSVVAALDSVLPGKVGSGLVKAFGRETGEELSRRILLMPASEQFLDAVRRVATGSAKAGGIEFSTEFAQSIIGNIATAYETNTNLPPDMLAQAIEEGVTGLFMGTVVGGAPAVAEQVNARAAPIREMRDAEFVATPQQAAIEEIQQREAAARGQVITSPFDQLSQTKLPARPVVPANEDRPTRPQLVQPTTSPVDRAGGEESFAIPKGKVTSKFGPRQTFKTDNGQMASSNHAGIDIALPSGAPVPAGASGVVVFAGKRGGYGNQVVVQHSDGTTSSYSHLSKIGAEVGDEVGQGEVIGKVGKTGNATGPHLHLERRDRQGRAVNPSTGAIVATSRNPETKEWEDDTEWAESQAEIDNFYDDMLDQQEADAAFTEATGQQWDPADFEPVESEEVTPAVARGEETPEPEGPSIRRGAAIEALGGTEAPEPAVEQERVSTRLTEAKDRNQARTALEQEVSAETQMTAEAAAPEGDYFQPLPGEEPVFGADEETGIATQEVVAFINPETQATRAIGEPPAGAASPPPAPVEPTPEELVATPPAEVPTEREATDLAFREQLMETLPQSTSKNPEAVGGRNSGQAVALGLMEPQPLQGMSKAYKTAYNLGLKEGQKALASAAPEDFVSMSGPDLATTPEIPDSSAETAATEFISEAPSDVPAVTPDAQATVEAIEDKLWDMEVDDAPKSKLKAYLKTLVKKGILEQAEVDSYSEMFADRDMGIEDIASEVRTSIQLWADRQGKPRAFASRRGKVPKSKRLEDIIPGYAKVVKYLAPDEAARMKRSAAKKLTDLYDSLPSPTEMAAVAISARDARGWYENSAQAIAQVFGREDGIRFAALLAATSPQNSVQLNLYNALKIWTAWNRAGRPTDRKSIVRIMGDSVAGDKGLGSVLNAWINNSVTALTADPDQLVLSGPKVNSFFANLIGEVDEVTNDTWMAVYAGRGPKFLQGTARRGGGSVKSVGYMAYSARVRKAAEVASRRTGDKWSPAEIQETVWSWAKTVYEMRDKAGENRTIRQMLDAGAVTTQDIANTEDFAVLFTEGVFANILEEGGYGQPVGIPKRGGANAPVAGGARPVTDAEGTGFTERDFQRNLRRAGDRLEKVRQERRGEVNERGKQEGAGGQQAKARGLPEQRGVSRSEEPVAGDRRKKLGFDKPLPGQPQTVNVPGYGDVAFGPLPAAQQAARDYMASIGQTYTPTKVAPSVNTERATRIAASFDAMAHNPQDPEVQAAYKAMIDETVAQWKVIEATGLKVEFIDFAKTGDPYAATPRLMQIDVAENNHMWVFKTDDGFGSDEAIDVSDNPMLALTEINIGGHQLRANDVFRIVHDYFGHVKDGHGFRAKGEEGAWQAHSQMYSPLARRALTTETRGQNSWVNYGPSGETNRDANSAETVYAPQKVGLLPQWAVEEGALPAPAFKESRGDSFSARAQFRPQSGGPEADDQRGAQVVQGAELERPPVEPDGSIVLDHYSTVQGLTATDPTRWGQNKGMYTREEVAYIEKAPPRTYFGIQSGKPGGYKVEFPGRGKYQARIPADRLYDVGTDADNLWVRGKPWIGERNIKDAGYAGYWHKNPELGMVAVVFEPVDVSSAMATADRRAEFESVGSKPAFTEATLRQVLATLKEMGIDPSTRKDLKLEVIADFAGRDYDGRYYFPQNWQDHPLIRIVALGRGDASMVARHEVIHWMRDRGIISKSEWPLLAKWAKNNPSLMAWAKASYEGQGLNPEEIVEEAVAEGFARWNGGDPALVAMPGLLDAIFVRIAEVIRKIKEAFGRAGVTRGELNEAAALMMAIRTGEQIRKYDSKGKPTTPLFRGFGRRVMADQAAFHGTRAADIDRFSLDFMGTGEGAQAFGWGLYFAQKKDIADWYRKKLTMQTNIPAIGAVRVGDQTIAKYVSDKFGPGYGTAMVEVSDRIFNYLTENKKYNGWLDMLQVQFEKDMAVYMQDAEASEDAAEVEALAAEAIKVEQLFDHLRMKDVKLDTGPTSGAVYKVEIPEDSDLLDLDNAVATQTAKVRQAADSFQKGMQETGAGRAFMADMETRFGDFPEWNGMTLQDVLKQAAWREVLPLTSDAVESAVENGEAAKAASIWLRDNGIPGSRFLDRDSRSGVASEKTRNFVLFDDGKIDIVDKELPRQFASRVVRDPQVGPLSDPTIPNPNIFRRIHDQTMAMLTTLGSSQGKGDWDAADSAIDAFRRKVTQRYQQVIKTQRRAAEQLGVSRLPAGQNPMEMITADERGYKLQHLTDNMIRPMAETMATRGVSMDDLGLYLYARHAPARNARIAKINPAFRDPAKPGSGMTDIEAANIMANFVADGKDADLAAAAVYIDRMVEMAQQERLQARLLTQDALDAGFQPQDHYVPLRGNEQIEPEMEMDFPLAARKGGGFSVAGGEAHRMFGRESRANLEEIVGYTITQAQEAIDRAYRNKVATTMLEMFRAVPDPNFVHIDRVKRVPVMKGGQVEYQMQTRMNDPAEQQRTIFVKDGDTIHKMTFNAKNPSSMRFVKAAKNLGIQELSRGLQLISVFTRLWSKSNTQWNIDFILANAAKDIQTGVLNASTLNQKGLRRAMLKNIASLKPLMATWMGSTKPAGAGASSANPWFKTFAEFEANGGKLNYGQITPLEDAIREAKQEIKNAKRSPIHPIKLATRTLGWIDHVNSAFENMTRLAAYKALRDGGIPAKQAAEAVRELTTNFQQHGEWGPKFNAAYGFANASVIGGARFLKTVATNPWIVTGLVAAGMVEDILNHMLDDDEWDSYTEEDKHANFMLMLPEEFGFDLKFPAGYGLNAFITTGRKMSELWRGKKNKDGTPMSMWDAGSDVMMGFVNAFAPITGATGFNILSPTLFDPIVNIYQNQNNWGRPIMPAQSFRKEQEKPDSQLAFDNTHQFWKSMATGMNALGGGNEVIPGWTPMDVSPESIKHVTEETVGGMGRTFMRTVKMLESLATGKDLGPNDIPIVRRFAGLPYGAATTKEEQTGAFYDRINEARVVLAQGKELALRFGTDSPEFQEYKAANAPIIEFREEAQAAEKRLRALNTAENAAERGVVRAEGLNKRDRQALFKVTGFMAPKGKPLTEEQVAKVKAKIKDEKAVLAVKFNDLWVVKVMGDPTEAEPPTP